MRFRKADLGALRRQIDKIRGPRRKEVHPILGRFKTWADLVKAVAMADSEEPETIFQAGPV
ncbi:MAG: hypothetical protein RBU21_20270 [FCB group bacterium]|nr:hypothetical protein [FCB group bacterium]